MGWWRPLLLSAAIATPAALCAYDLNPLKDRHRGGVRSGFGRSVDTVHEDITHAALACIAKQSLADALDPRAICSEPVVSRSRDDPGNLSNPLIVGLWWNDDPRQFLHASRVVSAALQWSEAQRMARIVRRHGGSYAHPLMRRMLYRSHFGELQFLHAMASHQGETAEETRERIIAWSGFAYGVATGTIRPGMALRELPPSLRRAFADEHSWTVATLFKPRGSMEALPLRDLALGSMLHVAQDSFSSSHAVRDMSATPGCPNGSVAGFHSFLDQETDEHRAADSRAALHHDTATRFTALQNPVEVSARLILMARSRVDWASVVEPYLRTSLFCLSANDTRPA